MWLHVHGVPLTIWDDDLFEQVGALFGRVLHIGADTLKRIDLSFWESLY